MSTPPASDDGRRRSPLPEIIACVLAVAAMLDGWSAGLIAPVFWGALLIVSAMILAALRGRVREVELALVLYQPALGLLVMALLQFAAISPGDTVVETSAHHHSGGLAIGAVGLLAPLAGVTFAALTVFALARARTIVDRVSLAILGITVMLTAGSVIGR